MSLMGAAGFIMKGSGLEELLSTVYASNTVEYILLGKAYSRALRAHMLISIACIQLLFARVS